MVRVLYKEMHGVKANDSKGFYLPLSKTNGEETVKNIIMRFLQQFSLQSWMILFRYQIYSKLGIENFLSYDVTLNNGTTRLEIASCQIPLRKVSSSRFLLLLA